MKKQIFRAISLCAAAVMLFLFAACDNSPKPIDDNLSISFIYDENSPYAPADNSAQSTVPDVTDSASVTDAPTAVPTDAQTTEPTAAETPAVSDVPTTPEEILAKYDEVVSNLKQTLDNGGAAYQKKEYQEVYDLDLGAASSIAQSAINQFMTPADEAEIQNRGDSGNIPPWDSDGCALTDTSFIKSATGKDNGDGTATLVIVLNDEKNPEPPANGVHSSETGKLFSPIKRQDILDTISGIPVVGSAVQSFDLSYHDCTATLVYNKGTGQVISLEQLMNIDIAATVRIIGSLDISGKVTNHIEINNVVYQ